MHHSEIALPVFQDSVTESDSEVRTNKQAAASSLATRIKKKLVAHKDMPADKVHITTHKGIVLLSGFVNSKKHKETAEKLTRLVDGVKNVKNILTTIDEAHTSKC